MELFEQIRREYTHGAGTIQGAARKLGFIGGWCGKRWRVRYRRNASARFAAVRAWVR